MRFTLAVAQFAPKKGDLAANLDHMAETALQAATEGADLVAFPESAATGYYLEDAAREHAVTAQALCDGLAGRLTRLDRPLDLLVGFYESAEGQPFNSAAYLELGPGGRGVVHVYRKFFLPTYGVFDEDRFHQRGMELGVFTGRLGRIGVLICEDVWHSVLGTLLAVNGAQVVLVPSASPVRGMASDRPGNVLRYERMLRAMAEEHGMYTAAAMLTGFEGGKGFSGGSMVFDPSGEKLVEADLGEPALVLAEIDLESVALARSRTPLLGDLRAAWPRIVELAGASRPDV
jgi:N-carbamoylputrescine amidase